jgi:hypothetical protein
MRVVGGSEKFLRSCRRAFERGSPAALVARVCVCRLFAGGYDRTRRRARYQLAGAASGEPVNRLGCRPA